MPRGKPRIGSFDRAKESLELGTISEKTLNPITSDPTSIFTSPDGTTVSVEDVLPPPPWETDPSRVRDDTDARSFVDCPREWVLRWVNPRLLDQIGWRWWEPVSPTDPRVKVLNRQMISVDGNVRRGGRGGDILAWMWRNWYESNQVRKQERTDRRTRSAVDRFEQLSQEPSFGPYIQFGKGTHPRQTIGEGKTMGEDH